MKLKLKSLTQRHFLKTPPTTAAVLCRRDARLFGRFGPLGSSFVY